MEPAFQRGDLLLLWNRSPRAELGEVVVYNVRGKNIPIVHRVVRTFPEVDRKTKNVLPVSEYGYLEILAECNVFTDEYTGHRTLRHLTCC